MPRREVLNPGDYPTIYPSDITESMIQTAIKHIIPRLSPLQRAMIKTFRTTYEKEIKEILAAVYSEPSAQALIASRVINECDNQSLISEFMDVNEIRDFLADAATGFSE